MQTDPLIESDYTQMPMSSWAPRSQDGDDGGIADAALGFCGQIASSL